VDSERSRALAFGIVSVVALVVSGAYVWSAATRADGGRAAAVHEAIDAEPIPAEPTLVYLNSGDGVYRTLSWAPLDAPDGPSHGSLVQCQRVYFAGERGLCAGTEAFGSGLTIFDRQLRVIRTLPLPGIASRARISGDGRYGATTFFVRGDSYAQAGFSTRTTIIEMATGAVLGDLEEFATFRDGQRFRSIDFNFWGVTFAADSNRFYATLGTRGDTYLVSGDIATRKLQVLRGEVECPSLSPDGTRLAFKKRMPGPTPFTVRWQLHVLDLATMSEVPVAESRSVDDQVEWLDRDRLVYHLPDAGPPATIRPDLWTIDLRGGPPVLLRTGATSAAVVR
jgi:hypothetical protein